MAIFLTVLLITVIAIGVIVLSKRGRAGSGARSTAGRTSITSDDTARSLARLQENLAIKHVYVGLAKAPVFALFIAVIGCRMGMTVRRDTRALGIATTSTVVQSIVAVILLDAAFAVLFEELGI